MFPDFLLLVLADKDVVMVWQIELKRPAQLRNNTLQIKFAFHCDSYLRSGKATLDQCSNIWRWGKNKNKNKKQPKNPPKTGILLCKSYCLFQTPKQQFFCNVCKVTWDTQVTYCKWFSSVVVRRRATCVCVNNWKSLT